MDNLILVDALSQEKSQIAFIHPDGEKTSYAQLNRLVNEHLQYTGLEKKLILIETTNEIELIVAYLAALKAKHPVILTAFDAKSSDNRPPFLSWIHILF